MICWPGCRRRDPLRRYCCTGSTKVVGRCSHTRGGAACRPVLVSRTLCGCQMVRHRPGTPNLCPLPCRCSVGRRPESEVREVESRDHDAADEARLVVARSGALPMPWWNDDLGRLARRDVRTEQMRCGGVLFGTELQQ